VDGKGHQRARLGSLLVLGSLGMWTPIHLWDNLSAFQGAKAWESAVTHYDGFVAQGAVAFLVLGSLIVHAAWGIGRLLTMRPTVKVATYANLKYWLQRLSAVGLLLFLGAHLWLAMVRPRFIAHHPNGEPFRDIAGEMRFHTPTLVVYVLGVLAVAYHLANGLSTFAMGWGIATSRRGLKHVEWASLLVFANLLAMGWGAIYALWVAGQE
jgi:succinate dehydrogenase / fumarate reductase cytochrome b subunit